MALALDLPTMNNDEVDGQHIFDILFYILTLPNLKNCIKKYSFLL